MTTTPRDQGAENQRRNLLARLRGFASRAAQRRAPKQVRNRADLEQLPPAAQTERELSLRVLSRLRDDRSLSLGDAAREEGTTPEAVRWHTRPGLERRAGRWQATPADRLYRAMYIFSAGEITPVDVRGSRKASEVSAYHHAVRYYLETGDPGDLDRFTGKTVDGVEYETDPDVLDEMWRRGQLSIESIYQLVT